MSDSLIDWTRHEERYLYTTFGHYAVSARPDRKPGHRSPMQRVMRQIKEFRGQVYHYHIHPGGWVAHQLKDFEYQSWFQLPATQKEEWLLRLVDWSGVSERTRDKLIAWQLRSRDGEINAQDEYVLHDQLTRVEKTTPRWDELSSTAKLETLLRAKDVDWRPFPPEFQAIALGYMVRRELKAPKEGAFEIIGVFEAKGTYPRFGRGVSSGRGGYQQSLDKGPKRPVFSKTTARDAFRWSVAKPHWEAFLTKHGKESDPAKWDRLRMEFREQMRPLWRDFWAASKKVSREGLDKLALHHHSQTIETLKAIKERQPATSEIGRERKPSQSPERDAQAIGLAATCSQVDFGDRWNERVAARREQAAQAQDIQHDHQERSRKV